MLISVVIPLYNKANTVKRALDSVLKQSVLPLEIIVVNDGSSDGSELVVQRLDYSFIRLIHQKNSGVSAARNKGIEVAKGDWIAFLDADDYWDGSFLQKMLTLHEDFPTAKVLACNYKYQNHRGEFSITKLKKLGWGNKKRGILENYFEVAAMSDPPIWSSAILVKKGLLDDIYGFPVGVTLGEDLLTWAKLAINSKIAYTTERLSTYVLDKANSYLGCPSRIPTSPDVVGQDLKQILIANPNTAGLKMYVAHWHKMRASLFLRLGLRKSAMLEIIYTLYYNPLQPKVYIYICLIFLPLRWVLAVFKRAT